MDADGSAEGDHLFRHIPLSATSSATTSTFKDSDYLIPGTLVAFTSGLPLCTTMRGKLLPRNYSGHRYGVAAGGLTGHAPTVAPETNTPSFSGAIGMGTITRCSGKDSNAVSFTVGGP